MDVINNIKDIPRYENLVISLGNFDGIHLGHRQLVKETVRLAESLHGTSAVLTFEPHPMNVVNPANPLPLLLTKEEKIRIFSELGLSLLVIMNFSHDLASLSPQDFVDQILAGQLGVKKIVIGYNYSFGHKGAGKAESMVELAAKHGIETVIVPPVKVNDVEVSSTVIRRLLLEGHVEKAAGLLGYTPFIKGQVVHGEKRGRTIGFPTANIDLIEGIVVPAGGVYVVRVITDADKAYYGVANIGTKPTFHDHTVKNLEIHLFDFNGDLYDQVIKAAFLTRIREEKKFSSVEQLVKQIKEDAAEAKNYILRLEHKTGA